MRVLFMGGKFVGHGCLKYLIETQTVVGVYVNPNDTAANRWYPSVTELALKNNIQVFSYRVNSKQSIATIESLRPDIIVVVYYDQILGPKVINIPSLGCINLHLALAEEYRGCYPTTWAIINNETVTGVTIHYITEDVDAGDILAEKKITIQKDWTGEDLYYHLSTIGMSLFKETFPKIPTITHRKQDSRHAKYYERKFPNREIELDDKTYNKIRALLFKPFPPPYIMIGKRKFIITEAPEDARQM